MFRPIQAGNMVCTESSAEWQLPGEFPVPRSGRQAQPALPEPGSVGSLGIAVCGLSHHSAPIDILEQLAFAPDARVAALTRLTTADGPNAGLVSEAVLLSTCNRVELYVVLADPTLGTEFLARFLTDFHGLHPDLAAPYLYQYGGEDAARHLFSVAGGLDSLILGEPQILGQVRRAFAESQDLGAAGPILSKLFSQAIASGKRIHCETGISHGAASVSYAAVEIAAGHYADLAACQALIVGAGKTGQLTAQCLLGQGVRNIAVANRSYDRAVELADNWGGTAYHLEDLERALPAADIVISCTDAPGYVVSSAQVASALAGRASGRPLLLIDIAVPRDIDPAAANLPDVRLYNIEDLRLTVEQNMADRCMESGQAEAIVDEQVADFMAWFMALSVKPLIVNLRDHAEGIRQRELERVRNRLPDLPTEYANIIDMMTQRIVNQLLHEPTVRLKDHASRSDGHLYAQAIRDLFALDSDQGRE